MNTQSDFEELLKLFEINNVAYMIVGQYGEVEVNFIAKEDLIKNKKASSRAQDLADLEKLEF